MIDLTGVDLVALIRAYAQSALILEGYAFFAWVLLAMPLLERLVKTRLRRPPAAGAQLGPWGWRR